MSLVDLNIGVARIRGDRETQMDRFDIRNHYFDEEGYSLFMIYDGHGDGRFSKHAKENLANFIVNDPEFKLGNYEKAFVNAFQQEDHALRSAFGTYHGGTTATVALFFKNSNTCYVANVGDSTAFLGSIPGGYNEAKAIAVSFDDKVDNSMELDRLMSAQAAVRRGRIFRPGHSVNMTRALGDFDFKAPLTPSGEDWISPIPHIHEINLVPYEDEFLIMASDGLWNVFNEQAVVDEITICLDRGYNVHQIASTLAKTAVKMGQPR
ncbi:9697_t:CDS:2, partial [Acaulospora morrowiae]